MPLIVAMLDSRWPVQFEPYLAALRSNMRHSLLHHRTMQKLPLVIRRSGIRFRQSKLAHDTSNRLDGGEESAELVGSPFPENARSTSRRASSGAFLFKKSPRTMSDRSRRNSLSSRPRSTVAVRHA